MAGMDVPSGFTAVNPPPAQPSSRDDVSASTPLPTAGVKRKREPKNLPKFYAVRTGRTPGIYHTWAECLNQVRGFPKAIFKSFSSLSDAEKFVNNEGDARPSMASKWYGVRSGRVPGVYTTWQEVLDQITGWKGPKHRGFKTRTEAERYVAEGRAAGAATADIPVGSIEQDASAHKKIKSSTSTGDEIKEESMSPLLDPCEYEPGDAPLPDDAEDGFDRDLILDPTTGDVRYKTREEREAYKYQAARPVKDAPIRIYTDGSSLSNGKADAWGGVGVYFGPQDRRNISEPLNGTKQTNQRAELTAIIRALEVAPKDRKIVIVSDSKYSIDCVTDWFHNWRRNGWVNASKRPVENRDLVQKILDMLEERFRLNEHRMEDDEDSPAADQQSHWDRGPGGVRFEWVKGHDKDAGNNAADSLATAGARSARDMGMDVHLSS